LGSGYPDRAVHFKKYASFWPILGSVWGFALRFEPQKVWQIAPLSLLHIGHPFNFQKEAFVVIK